MGAKTAQLVRVPDQVEERKKAEALVKALRPLVKKVLAGPLVRTDDAYQEASDARRVVVTTNKQIVDKRKSITKHMDAAKRGVMSLFKPMEVECECSLELIDEKLTDYEDWKQKQAERLRLVEVKKEEKRLATLRRNELKKLEEAKSRQERLAVAQQYDLKRDLVVDEANAAQEMIDDSPPVAEGQSIRKLWDFEIENVHLVPREYQIIEVSREKVLDYCRNVKNPQIRGLRLFQKPSRASRKF